MKSKQSKKSVKKAPAAKKKSAAKKKPVQKNAKLSKPVSGKKSSGRKHDPDKMQVTVGKTHIKGLTDNGAWEIKKSSAKKQKPGFHLNEQLARLNGLIKRDFPAKDIQIVLRYKTIGGVVEERGIHELRDSMTDRVVKWDPSMTDYQIVPGANVRKSAATKEQK